MNSQKDLLEFAIKNGFITLFDYDKFKEFRIIGKGAFGTVRRAYLKLSRNHVALKSIHSKKFVKEVNNNITHNIFS